MSRGGRHHTKDQAERRCIATGASQPRAGLIRFVVGPESQIVPDVANKLPGRGIWVSATAEALSLAISKKLFAKSAKQSVTVPDNLAEQVEDLLAKNVVQLISLSRKGGRAITGYEKVKRASEDESVAVLLQASDGSEPQKRKIRPPDGANNLVSCLTAQELGLAFGRENVIHAALAAGGLTKRIVEEAARLAGVRRK